MKSFVTLSLAILAWLLPAPSSSAAVVSWGFSGVFTRVENNSNAVPNTIVEGMPFTGVVTYDTATLEGPDSNQSPSSGNYYFRSNGLSIVVHAGGATFSSTNNQPGSSLGSIAVNDNFSNSYDEIYYGAPGGPPLVNGVPFNLSISNGGIDIYLDDSTKTALSSDALPLRKPTLSAFATRRISLLAYAPGAEYLTVLVEGDITAVSDLPKVLLSHRPLAGNQLRLSWPVSATDLTLQFTTSLTTQNWTTEPTAVVDTATEHTVTVSTAGQPKFFRLVKFP